MYRYSNRMDSDVDSKVNEEYESKTTDAEDVDTETISTDVDAIAGAGAGGEDGRESGLIFKATDSAPESIKNVLLSRGWVKLDEEDDVYEGK